MSSAAGAVLITGADGYLGRRIARLFQAQGVPLVLWVRAAGESEAETKRVTLAKEFPSADARIEHGDLRADNPFERVDPRGVRFVVHTAAVTRFNVDEPTARAVNIEGTAKLVRFAARCPGLERLVHLSTIYASGLAPGPVPEETLPAAAGFANHYEGSKWASEGIVQASGLPWRIVRVATVVADDASGVVGQQNAVHNTLRLLFYGLISTLPGMPATPLYLVTGDVAAEAAHAAAASSHLGDDARFVHAAHRREQSLTLDRLVDLVFEVFGADETFRRRRLPRPLYVDAEAFELLRGQVAAFSGAVVGDAVASIAPFARQLFVVKEVANERLLAALGRDPAPDPESVVRRACEHLVRTRWGRHDLARSAEG